MSEFTETRKQAVDQLIHETHELLNAGTPDRYVLSQIQLDLQDLAAQTEFWDCADYPEPDEEERQNRFLIHSDGDNDITLYLNVMRPGKKIPAHDHTTWACVAAAFGVEVNTLYDRIDDGAVEGKADLRVSEVIDLGPGSSVAMMPNDIHSVEIKGEDCIRHLHFYGQPLETLKGRTVYDVEAGTYKMMTNIGVKTKT